MQYRPFVKQHCYVDDALVQHSAIRRQFFPSPDADNRAICVPGVGSTKPFSALMVNTVPDLHYIAFGQCFPRYRFEAAPVDDMLGGATGSLQRVDNITGDALERFRAHYCNPDISKDDIFDYVYGVLHAPDFRDAFPNALAKELARIPLAGDFAAFADAGRKLGALHLGYESCQEYPLDLVFAGEGTPNAEHYWLGGRAMRYGGKRGEQDRSVLAINDHLQLTGIPGEAHCYVVNGRTPLDWFIDRYTVSTDKKSGILNDANEWFEKPEDLVTAIRRIVFLSVETVRIVNGLPEVNG